MTRWRNTTHDWAAVTDVEHLAAIRKRPDHWSPGGALHLVLEVVAYAADEAADAGAGRCRVALRSDGSVCVSDDGRGTDTRRSEAGVTIKKPVMSTRDLRFFDSPSPPDLADGHPRRGISVVAALSTWLVHTNRRLDGSWTQRYERGVPVTDLVPAEDDGSTGTTVEFLPDLAVLISDPGLRERLEVLAWPPPLVVDVTGDGPLAT